MGIKKGEIWGALFGMANLLYNFKRLAFWRRTAPPDLSAGGDPHIGAREPAASARPSKINQNGEDRHVDRSFQVGALVWDYSAP